jgi:hypothetical protein
LSGIFLSETSTFSDVAVLPELSGVALPCCRLPPPPPHEAIVSAIIDAAITDTMYEVRGNFTDFMIFTIFNF